MAAPPLPHRHSGAHVSPFHEAVQLRADTANVAVSRRFVRNALAACDADELVADLELVSSELVTNAILHATGDIVDVSVSCDGNVVTLSVTSIGNDHQVGPSRHWRIAEPDSITGRGLGIVRSLADRIEVRHRAGALQIVVERNLSAA
ncbi:MAG: ATP-binding protein [Ilumatobacter sp.]|nr:MAG: ATP-binding protein [Ilumatobacter sp.]